MFRFEVEQSPESILIAGRKGQRRFPALVDTGAVVSVVPKKFAEVISMEPVPWPPFNLGDFSASPINNQPMRGNFFIEPLGRWADFVAAVPTEVDFPKVILGRDFLEPFNLTVRIRNGVALLSVR